MSVRIQDDLYQAVNGEWLKSAVIPDDRPTTGGFADLDQEVEKILMKDFKEMACGDREIPNILGMKDAIKYYKQILNIEKRNQEGISPLMPLLNKIKAIKSLDDFNSRIKELAFDSIELPINFFVQADMKDALNHSFTIQGPDIILPDTTYYGNDAGKSLLEIYQNTALKLMDYTDLTDADKKRYVEDTLEFDELVSKRVKSQLEWADHVNDYNPMAIDDVIEYLRPFDIRGFLYAVYGDDLPRIIIVRDPRAIKEFKEYFNETTFTKYLHWLYVRTLLSGASFLSEEMTALSHVYRRSLVGIEKDPVLEKQAYQRASSMFDEPIGVYYGRTYFGEEAKQDVVLMVKKIIKAYEGRMRKNTFLEEATKEKALLKLANITIKMGYPDEVHQYYELMSVNEEDSYFETTQKLSHVLLERNLNKLNKAVDKTEWEMPGHMVNACYDPSKNDITFPSAILQKPFYAIDQSVSENLGGIGAVIGHEISHAFDNNGAHFDENGNLNNWWLEKDFAEFEKLTKNMIEQFDGIDFCGGKVNGELVVSENIADNGGMGATLEILHQEKDADFEAYFKNWARVWCHKSKEEYVLLLLSNDVHAPGELRSNMQPRNFQEWYDTFGVTHEDKMYLPEEKRITIW